MTPAQRAAALADPVVNCKRAGISLGHITATLSRVELAALVDVLAAQVAGPPPRYREVAEGRACRADPADAGGVAGTVPGAGAGLGVPGTSEAGEDRGDEGRAGSCRLTRSTAGLSAWGHALSAAHREPTSGTGSSRPSQTR